LWQLAQLTVALDQKDVQLTRNGIGRTGTLQAALQERDGLGLASQVGIGPAQVEQREGIVGAFGLVQIQEAQVAFELAAPQGGIDVAGVGQEDVGEVQLVPGPADGEQDLFVDTVVPADGGVVAKEADLIDEHGRAAVRRRRGLPHDESGVLLSEIVEQAAELVAVGIVEELVGVEPENPFAAGMAERFVASGGEAVGPVQGEDAGIVPGGDVLGVVAGAGVHDDDFVHQIAHRVETACQRGSLVLDDHGQRHARPLLGNRKARRGRFYLCRRGGGRNGRASLGRSIATEAALPQVQEQLLDAVGVVVPGEALADQSGAGLTLAAGFIGMAGDVPQQFDQGIAVGFGQPGLAVRRQPRR
jgi:hypothetical protein